MALKAKLFIGSALIGMTSGLALSGSVLAQDAPILQPGAPGEAARELTAEEAVQIAANRYSDDDVRFMQGMILHHFQAVQMSGLVNERTNTQTIREIAERIDATQEDEIEFMRGWLVERAEDAPDPFNNPHAMHHGGHHDMSGMATPEQMTALGEASGMEFDALFLELMITHHEGAVEMVDHLLDQRGSAYDPVLLDFVNDVRGEQQAEIRRMSAFLSGLSEDPRNGLAAGFRDAEEAISNLSLLASLPKPTGFFDVENPAGLPPLIAPDATDEEVEREFGDRAPFLSFSQTDMAFSGELMAVGNYHGINLYNITGDEPQLISSIVCPGGQGDVSIVGDLMIMSVQDTRGRIDCGRQGVEEEVSEDRFRGIRIFDISNPVAPRQVGLVQTCRGSHTHSVVSSDENTIVVYNSGTSSIRPEEELEGCVAGLPGDDETALFSIDVIEIPVEIRQRRALSTVRASSPMTKPAALPASGPVVIMVTAPSPPAGLTSAMTSPSSRR